MKLAVLKEQDKNECRVAATPETVKKFIDLGFKVTVEKSAGELSSFPDAEYKSAGATIGTAKDADIILKINAPTDAEIKNFKKGACVIAHMNALINTDLGAKLDKAGLNGFAMEMVPRITRAQSMDILSSQSNLAGYRAVIDAAATYGKAFPMMMTAAGTVSPAKVMVLGAGVAGLQAIATAKRLGAIVSAFDVRPAVKEQVESLGAKFIEVDPDATKDAETKGGYAKEMSAAYQKKQAQKIHDTLKTQDIAITTALIPGKKAPILITDKMLSDMKQGSVIVDLAAGMGGNVEGSAPDKIIIKHGVTLIGHTNMASRIAFDASKLFAKNILNFVTLLVDKEAKKLTLNMDDEIIAATLLKPAKAAPARKGKKS